jgi:phosphoenolpyruvate carboxylase
MFNRDVFNDNQKIKIEVVPLFETVQDLDNSTMFIDKLLQTELYKENLQVWNNSQTIMLGFSDGTKDGGYFMANWSIFEAKRNLNKYFVSKNIKPIFFDGRGGPPSRGGGDMFLFYKGLSNAVSNHDVQLTIQGQSISSKFASIHPAQYNLEQLVTSGLYSKLNLHNVSKLTKEENELISKLAQISFESYSELKGDPQFMDYMIKITPLKYMSEINVGSRPAKRNTDAKIEFDDLRAIPYGAAWVQMRQSILAYYGLGTAISKLISEDDGFMDKFKHIYSKSLIIKGIIDNALQSIGQANFNLTKHISENEEFGEFWYKLYNEYELSKKHLLEIVCKEEFLHINKVKERSIIMRDNITLPLSVLQQYALDALRKNPEHENSDLLKIIIRKTLISNVNANHNSI